MACNDNLQILVESSPTNINLIFFLVRTITVQGAVTPMSSPIPNGTTITDHIKRQMDRISITSMVGCLTGCFDNGIDLGLVYSQLKSLQSELVYTPANFVDLTSNYWRASRLILESWTVSHTQDKVQRIDITTNWVGANIAGSIQNPSYEAGGIIV